MVTNAIGQAVIQCIAQSTNCKENVSMCMCVTVKVIMPVAVRLVNSCRITVFILPGLVVVYDFTVPADVFDKVHTVRFRFIIERHGQHLSVLEFGCVPRYFVIDI